LAVLSSQDYISLLYEARQPIRIADLANRLGLPVKTVKFMIRPLEIMHCIERMGSMVRAVRENFDTCISLLRGSEPLQPGKTKICCLAGYFKVFRAAAGRVRGDYDRVLGRGSSRGLSMS